jgi:Arc/MetJ family transcription regulator
MRTNIEIDDSLIDKAIKLSHAKSKKEVVNLALKEFVATLKRKELLHLRGKVKWEGDLNLMRRS